jgi:DNA-binding SARP family transcriptional activator
MEFLEWDQLRFTLEESRKIVRLRTPKIRSKEAVKRLHQITDGWAAGLVLISDAVRRGFELQSLEKVISEEIVNYFGSVIFTQTGEETRDFLIKTAFLPRMTIQMSEKLTGAANEEAILSGLTKDNFFIEKLPSETPVFQYHPLFRNFLLSRAKELLSQEAISELNMKAAVLLEESGQTEDAAQIYMGQKHWEGLIRLVMRHAPPMMAQGRYQLLEKWLTALPEALVENTAWLLFWLGSCRFPFDLSSSLRYLEKAFNRFSEAGDMPGAFLAWAGIVDGIDISHDDLSRLDYWVRLLEGLMRRIKEFPSQEIGARVASGMVTALSLRQPQHPEFHKWADHALSLTESPQTIHMRIFVLANLVLHGCLMGELDKASQAFHQLSQLTRSRDASPFYRITGKLIEAIYYQNTGYHQKCTKAVSEGLELSRKTGIHIFDQSFLGNAISSSLNINDFETASNLLNRLTSSINRSPSANGFLDIRNRLIYHFSNARHALASGDLTDLHLQMEMAVKYCRQANIPAFLSMTHFMNALALHKLGKKEEAMDQLQKGSLISFQIKSKSLEFGSLLIQSYFSFDRGDDDSGLRTLQKALALGKDQRLLNTHFDDPSVTASLCAKALEAGIEVEYVREIIQKRNLIPEKSSFQLEQWPWPLKIYTLGRFEILKDGKPIPFSRKAQEKPLSILKVLIAMGEKEIRPEEIADIVWPEADGDSAYHSFQVTLHRLRSLIGYSEAVQVREGHLTLDPCRCWVDAWAFERLLEEADNYWKERIAEKAIQLTEKAMALYQGPFLGMDAEQSWKMPVREKLRNKFLRSVSKLGDHWIQAGQWETARECYLKGFEVDDLAEGFCRGLMVCYQRLNQRAEALSLYQRFEKRLKAVLGIEPSEKTKTLRDEIVKK